ncbi:iron-siderophore ABC transporter substrate-binding protein [Gloeocapsopsis crepidinum LEGE 06123]|uniref:Iron-siderophore ABC transporter substrate-binding protein n=1 Tax=Gloeocapsopsis crepidinum LEGE 06123 TaxID=588587 RepID=A0ABR9UMN0_9CHRO|nr:iron-siderophore ABC transporter substrate-binding protein [Gloeocapsopsis crepidinum]MBE9189290.1 iron-siderophore ABC transporter substrate-binding protein [Gloeocapsopsis crepidinum LEGE 06123]
MACGRALDGATHNLDTTSSKTDCRSVQHDAGHAEICGQPQTIAVLGPHALDLLLSLDEQPDAYADVFVIHTGRVFDRPNQQIPYLGDRITTQPINLGNRDQPSLETLYALQPDLVLGETGGSQATYEALSRIAPTILWDVRTQRGKWRHNIRQLAQALGDEKRADRAIATYEHLVKEARKALAPTVVTHSSVLLLGTNQLSHSITAITQNSYLGELFEGLGFELVSVPHNHGEPSTEISLEVLPNLAADTIFVLGHDLSAGNEAQSLSSGVLDRVLDRQISTTEKSWNENAIAQSLPASQRDQVYFVTYYLWNGLNGPIGAKLILDQLNRLLL